MFSLHDIHNKIYIQFCMNTFDHVISYFLPMRMNTISVGHCTTFTWFTNVNNTCCTEGNR